MPQVRLRDPLVTMLDKESPAAYADRVLDAAHEIGGAFPNIRLQIGTAFSLSGDFEGDKASCSLWVDRNQGVGRSESWQKVSISIISKDHVAAAALFLEAMTRRG